MTERRIISRDPNPDKGWQTASPVDKAAVIVLALIVGSWVVALFFLVLTVALEWTGRI